MTTPTGNDRRKPTISLDAMPIPLAKEKGFAWVDAGDVSVANMFKWSLRVAHAGAGPAYAITNAHLPSGKKGTYGLHRLIGELAGLGSAKIIDHIDRDGLNCTRRNLRAATCSLSQCNRGRQKSNTSGFKGVHWSKQHHSWCSRGTFAGKRFYLGMHRTAESAARAYDAWALATQGEFAVINFPEEHNGQS